MEFTGALFDSGKPWLTWEGIVVKREEHNTNNEGFYDPKEVKNWGNRVKVRIETIHPEQTKRLQDSELPWLEVPAGTDGSGHGGVGSNHGITQGTRVWGIWGNPLLKENPILVAAKVNNEETILDKIQKNGFDPFSGFKYDDVVSMNSIPSFQGKPLEGLNYANLWNMSDISAFNDPNAKFSIASPSDCEIAPTLAQAQPELKALIKSVEKARSQLKQWQGAAQGWIADKQAYIQKQIAKATQVIFGCVRWIYDYIMKKIMEQINDKTKKLYYLVNPPDRDKVKSAKDVIVEAITCLFSKLLKSLFGLIGKFLLSAIDRFVNVPMCAIENFLSQLLANTLGTLGGAIDSIISSLSSILGAAFSIADSILGLLQSLLGFFLCEEKQECPKTKEWDIFAGGQPSAVIDIASIFNQAKGIASSASALASSIGAVKPTIDLNNMLATSATSCNVGPVFCAPPTVTFWGGNGSGAKANAIVSALGDIIGIDIKSPGNYTEAPFVTFSDNCGKGSGARGTAILGPVGTDSQGNTITGVVQVPIEDPGYGYLPTPNGDLGGDGRTWATADQTIVHRADGTYDIPYNPGEEITPAIQPGDYVSRPSDRNVIGIGSFIPGTVIPPEGTPEYEDYLADRARQEAENAGNNGNQNNLGVTTNYPSLSSGSYPVILYLCDVQIVNAGLNYSPNDKIVIENNSGNAQLEVKYGPFGVVESVKIIDGGKGFTDRPNIYIESETGYNAEFLPVLCVNRVGDDTEGEIPEGANFVTVVDCVGKF